METFLEYIYWRRTWKFSSSSSRILWDRIELAPKVKVSLDGKDPDREAEVEGVGVLVHRLTVLAVGTILECTGL